MLISRREFFGGILSYRYGANKQKIVYFKPFGDSVSDTSDRTPVKNQEGYNDLTAKKAIDTVMKEDLRPAEGEVWTCETSGNLPDQLIFIIRPFGDCCQYFELKKCASTEKQNSNAVWTRSILVGGVRYILDIRKMGTKPIRYIKKKAFDAKDHLQALTKELASVITGTEYISISASQAFADKKKELEASYANRQDPKEKIDVIALRQEIAVLSAKVEIYEKLIFERAVSL